MRLAKSSNHAVGRAPQVAVVLVMLVFALVSARASAAARNQAPEQTKSAGKAPAKQGKAASPAGPPAQAPARTPTKTTAAPAAPATKQAAPAAQSPKAGATKTPAKSDQAKKPPAKTSTAPKQAAKPVPENKAQAKTAPPKPKAKEGAKTKNEAPVSTQRLASRRDPFDPLVGREKPGGGNQEHLPPGKAGLVVSTLRLDGVVRSPRGMLAVVSNPQQRVYFLREGDQLYDGRVERITMDAVSFHETGKDPFGKPVERLVSKHLYSSAGEQR